MKRKLVSVAIAAAFGLCAAPVFSADADKRQAQPTVQKQNSAYYGVRGSKLIGMDVQNAQGENLGEIDDVIVNSQNGQVHYAVLSFGGFMKMGDKLFAYPMSAFKLSNDNKLVLHVDKEELKQAKGFDERNWPDWNDPNVRKGFDRTFKVDPVKDNALLVRTSWLIDQDINDLSGKEIGEVDDVVFNLRNNRVHYVVAELDDWGMGDKVFALPVSAFSTKGRDLVMNLPKERINDKFAFDDDRWPNINDERYVRDMDTYFSTVSQPADRAGVSGRPGDMKDRPVNR
jgi:sporulation protein YlmC with PRC-barrel domain